ncbi:MAG: hypothetical protein J6Y57_05015, partial [Lachnospiraceae bacterium]|nr:hypothetical protein [Lachnospiraceae bacterium]
MGTQCTKPGGTAGISCPSKFLLGLFLFIQRKNRSPGFTPTHVPAGVFRSQQEENYESNKDHRNSNDSSNGIRVYRMRRCIAGCA